MRIIVAITLLIAAAPQHRRFLQKGLPGRTAAAGCATTPAACSSGVTNVLKSSQDFTTADWGHSQTGGAVPALTANYGTAPNCTHTSTRIQLAARGVTEFSLISQAIPNLTVNSGSIWVKSTDGVTTGTAHLWQTSTGLNPCKICNFTGAWARCQDPNVAVAGGATFYFGSDPLDCGTLSEPALDLEIWGPQDEAGASVTGYVPTTLGATASCP